MNSKSRGKKHGSIEPDEACASFFDKLGIAPAESFPKTMLLWKFWGTDDKAYFLLQSTQTGDSISGLWDDLRKIADYVMTHDGSDF